MLFYIHGGYGEVGPTHLTVTQTFVGSNPTNHLSHHRGVAELADALDLGSSVARREGSSPFSPICTTVQQDPTGLFPWA